MRYPIALALLALVLVKPVLAQTCPAGNPLVAPNSRYQVSEPVGGEFVVEDLRTGLMWKQCVQGRSGTGCATGADNAMTWSQALAAAGSETHAGYSDWRLPSANELRSLVESGCHTPAINTTVFPATASNFFWSSSTFAPDASRAWFVVFDVGILNANVKSSNHQVRLVRGGQWLDPFNSARDFTPDAFGFAAQTGVPLSEPQTSASITVSGIDTVVGIGISGAADSAYSINGGEFVSTPGVVVNGDSVVVRHTSAAAPLTSVTSTLRIGALVADFVSTTAAASFRVGGTVNGLAGSGLVLQNNGGDDLPVVVEGGFTFPTALEDGSAYAVSVRTQPSSPNQTCSVSNGTGLVSGSDIGDVQVNCVTNSYVVSTNANNGTITSPINPVVSDGDSTTVTGEAAPGHFFASVSGCGGEAQSNSDPSITGFSYQTGPITSACVVQADFIRVATDLQIAKSSSVPTAVDGQIVVYSIVVTNAGPLPANGAQLIDMLPTELVDSEWACLPDQSNTACPPPPFDAGVGNLVAWVDLPVNGFLRYDLSARVRADGGASVSNTASVEPPVGLGDLDSSNNSATSTLLILPEGLFANGFEEGIFADGFEGGPGPRAESSTAGNGPNAEPQ